MYRIIFRHYPKKGKVRDFIRAWQKVCDIIVTYPGAIEFKLFHSHDDPQIYYGIADWRSEEDRASAFQNIAAMRGGEAILRDQEQYLIDGRGEVVAQMELIAESNPPEK